MGRQRHYLAGKPAPCLQEHGWFLANLLFKESRLSLLPACSTASHACTRHCPEICTVCAGIHAPVRRASALHRGCARLMGSQGGAEGLALAYQLFSASNSHQTSGVSQLLNFRVLLRLSLAMTLPESPDACTPAPCSSFWVPKSCHFPRAHGAWPSSQSVLSPPIRQPSHWTRLFPTSNNSLLCPCISTTHCTQTTQNIKKSLLSEEPMQPHLKSCRSTGQRLPARQNPGTGACSPPESPPAPPTCSWLPGPVLTMT